MDRVIEDIEILLVEDDPNDLELTQHALKAHNLANKLQIVRDGAEALEFLFGTGKYSHRPVGRGLRLVLLDLKLPKVDGLEVLRQLRDDPRTAQTPVVALTSSREESDLLTSYQLGINSYIVKPVDFEQFSRAVANIGMYWLLLNRQPFYA
jgi:two-component system response regulator